MSRCEAAPTPAGLIAITWDGLFVAQSRSENGGTDVYWVDAWFVDRMKPAQ